MKLHIIRRSIIRFYYEKMLFYQPSPVIIGLIYIVPDCIDDLSLLEAVEKKVIHDKECTEKIDISGIDNRGHKNLGKK